MKLQPKEIGEDIELDMSPMIDMVFLLLIFFIVASQVIDEKPEVEIPEAAHAKVPEDTTGRIMITVTEDGDYFLGSVPVTLDELKEKLAEQVDPDSELKILIRSDGDTKYKLNQEVMVACAEVGANDLIFSAFEE